MTRILPWRHALLPALALLLAACAGPHSATRPVTDAATATDAAPTPLLLVSIDGYRADFLQRGQSPALMSMAASGVRAKWMQPSFPSLTFPNHYTLVTGLYPDHHGIIGNNMYDTKLGKFSLSRSEAVRDGRWWDEAEPIWVSADRQGLTTATMFWPGSEAEIHGYRPDYWIAYNGAVTARQRVDQILAWLDLPPGERPDFLTLYFDEVDHAGHGHGPDSSQVNAAMRLVDSALSQLLTGLRARGLYDAINIVVVSDHGMASVPPDNNIFMDKLIDMDDVHIVSMGVLAGFNYRHGDGEDVADALLKDHPHMRCWRKGHFPERLHYGHNPRTPDISCLADVGWRISTTGWVEREDYSPLLGNHGYDNRAPEMRAIFIAHGPAFADSVVLQPFPNTDVYPLLAHLLGIAPQNSDGNLEPFKAALKP